MSHRFLLKPLAAALLVCAAGASHAAITVYTSMAAFNTATSARSTDTFAGLSITGSTPTPVVRTVGPYSYTANATPAGLFFGGGTTADPFLSTNTATDTIVFNAFTGGVRAVGGNFFGSDVSGAYAAGGITITATDASGTVTQTLAAPTQSSFLGFVSTGAMTSVTVVSIQPLSGFLWPSVDNLVLASAVAVPEPGTYGLMFAGLGIVGLVARRRRG